MDYSTLTQNLTHDQDGVIFDLRSLFAHLLPLRDLRQRRGRRYALALILVLIVLAKLAGEDKPAGIADWARQRAPFFVEVFDLARARLPSHNTYRRVLHAGLAVDELEACVGQFLAGLPAGGTAVQLTLDGKTLRGTIPPGETRGLHLLAAYLPSTGVVLFQVAVDRKENEISAAPRVLKVLDLQGKIVTGDALLAQRELSQLIVDAGGDYVWTVKDNQPQLKQDIEQLFQPEHCVPGFSPAPTDFRTARTVNKGHGRLEVRTLTTSSLLNETCDWPGLGQVFKLEREFIRLKRGETPRDVVYGVTSLTAEAATPDRLLELVRGHWGQENGLHYRRDVTFQEDACRMKSWRAAQALACLNNLALALLLRAGALNVAQARRHYAAHPDEALQLLLGRPT